MSFCRQVTRGLRGLLHGNEQDREIGDEVRHYFEEATEAYRARGLSEQDARHAARLEFGNPHAAEEEVRSYGWENTVRTFSSDLRYGLRQLRRNPGFTAVAVLTLALGIGANSVVLSVVRTVLLRPLDYANPDRLVQLWDSGERAGGQGDWVSFPDFRDWKRDNRVFEEMAAYRYAIPTMTGNGEPESVLGLQATDRLFATLGVQPLLGRTFSSGDDKPGHENVAVISSAFWKRHFGGDPAVCGKSMGLDGISYTIIGVMPPSFRFPANVPEDVMAVPIDLWMPIRLSDDLEQRTTHNYWAIARLKLGVTLKQARMNMQLIAANIAREDPDTNEGIGVTVVSLQDHIVQGVHNALLILLGAVGTVLLLGCINIASILLSRAESRRREIAIRQAIGAGRGRLIRQSMTESLLLAFIGGTAGLALAFGGIKMAIALSPANIPRIQQTSIDPQVIFFTAAISLLVGILFGLAPTLLAVRSDMQRSLKESEARSTANRANLTIRHLLIGGQMALAVLLLVGAGLFIHSFLNVVRIDPGFRPKQVLTGYINLPEARYADGPKQVAFFEEALRRIQALAGVQSAAVGNSVPLTGENDQGGFGIEGRPEPPVGQDGPQANRPRVSVDYFKTMGIQVVKGRPFNEHDVSGSPYVAVISDLAARTYWPSENPIGERVTVDSVNGKPVWRQIVGIVRSTRHFGLEAPPKPEIYLPHTQAPCPFMILVVRTKGDPSGLLPAIRHEIAAIDPKEAGFGFQTMEELIANSESRRQFQVVLLTGFGAVAAFLAATGIYGVMSHTVAQRTREIGLRMALGALPREVVAMLLKQGITVAAIGMAVGIVGALALSRVFAGLLFGVSPVDPSTFAGVVILLLLTATISAYMPSRVAARIDPTHALREE